MLPFPGADGTKNDASSHRLIQRRSLQHQGAADAAFISTQGATGHSPTRGSYTPRRRLSSQTQLLSMVRQRDDPNSSAGNMFQYTALPNLNGNNQAISSKAWRGGRGCGMVIAPPRCIRIHRINAMPPTRSTRVTFSISQHPLLGNFTTSATSLLAPVSSRPS